MRKNKNGGGITQKGYKCVRSLLAVVLAALLMFGTFGTALAEDLSDVNITSEEQTENDTDIQDEGEELSGDDSDIDGDTADGSTSDDIFTETTDGTGEDDPAAPAEEGDALDGETDEEEPDAEEEDNLIAAASIEPDGKAESEYTLELGDSLVIPGVEVTDNSGGALNVGKYYEPASMVEADKSYVLMNCETSYSSSGTVKSYYILSNTTATTSNGSNTGIAFTSVSGGTYSGLECIERTDADPVTWSKSDAESGKYYLQTTVEGTDANGNPETTTRYAGTSFNSDYSSSVWDEGQAAGDLSLTDKDSATAFSVLSAGDDYYYPGRGYVFLEGEDSGRSNIIAYDSPSAASFAISWWPGDEAYIWYFCTPCIVVTPSGSTGDYTITVDDSTVTIHVSDHHAESVDPANTTINLFDYWITDGDSRFEPDYFSVSDFTSGINGTGSSGSHTLLFYKDHDGIGTNGYYNDYEYSKLYKGIVSSTLGDDGYPMLNSTVTSSSESLAYLFNPDETSQAGKTTFTDVRGLLQKDDKGYYYYDSTQNFAEFDEESNAFTLYNDWKVTDNGEGQFFPFNKYSELSQSTDSYSNDVNHYFGMTMTTSFTQQAGGKSLSTGEDTTFEFSGDDDVWIFIDGVLVADIGGIHDKASATIDFSTGEVKVRVSTAPEEGESSDSGFTYGYSTKLYDAYEAVGKENTTTWNDENNPTTFAEDTTHTLNFFYLERGNGASNLALTTNLETSPESEIIKTDQDGNAVEGATFAVYAADSDGNYKTESSTMTSSAVAEKLAATVDGYHYDEDGNICDSSDDVVLKALYKGTTGEDGRIDFENSDGAYYSLTELKELFGDHFYLREISVPSGYRNIADDVLLKFSDSLNLMTLANAKDSYTTGVWVTPSIRVRAPSVITANSEKVDYYTAGNEGSVNGTLFAVALKKENGSWYPVYGTDTYGYHVVSGSDMESIVTAAKNQASIDGGDLVFSYDSDSGDMQTYVNHLPGDISKYDFMLNNDSDAEYKVAYYYSTADSISGITSANTSEAGGYNDTVNDVTYNFSTAYASDIEYPDINNTLYVRKTDNEGTAMNGAVFGLYKVSEIEGTVYYVADDNSTLISLTPYTDDEDDSENDGTAAVNGGSTGTYKINADGTISVSAGGSSYTINPVQTDTTASNSYVKANGIAEFDRLENGTYCVLEISVHDGYRTNKNPVRVLVDDSGVYANAGTQGDGITVARGTGALVATMHESASDDDINDTLSYITATMTENTSMSFDVDPGTFTSGTSVSLTHDADSVFGYSYDDDTDDTWPLRTEAGWVGMNVYQDTTALSGITGADYTNLNGTNIASLYAGGVFAIVADDPELINVNVEVKWEDYENINKLRPENVSVTLTGTANGSTVENKTKTITDDGTWTCKFEDLPYYKVYESFDSDGNPLGTEYVQISYSVTEAAVDHYSTSIDPESAVSTGDDLSFTVTNTLGVGSLTVSKTLDGDYADPTKEFTFTITLDNEDINGERGGITFTNGSATITLKGGESLTATLLPEGTGYTVTETGDHSGYEVSPAEATGTIVADETVTAAFTNTYSVTPATVTIQGIKTMTDGTTPEEGAYTFKLEGEDGTSLEAKNDGTGVFTFNDLTFNDTGTYTYTVSEVRGSDDEIVYDTNTYTVEVVVTDNGDGTISAVATVDGEAYTTTSISFVNSIAEEEPTPEPTPSNPDDETGTGESTPEGETGTEEGTPEGETGTEEGTPEGETGSEEGTPDSVTEPAGDVNGDISDAEPDGETSGADETSTGDAAYPGAYLLIIIACAAAAAVVFRRRRV